MRILKYNDFLFEVAKLRDISNILTKDDDLKNRMNTNRSFNSDEDFINNVYLEKYDKNITLRWKNNKNHDFVHRVKTRTNFDSMSEFNDYFSKLINELFNNHFDSISKFYFNYSLYDIDRRITFIIGINYNNLFKDRTDIYIRTVTTNMSKQHGTKNIFIKNV